MNKIKKALLILLLFQSTIGFSQSQTECKKILSKEINLDFNERRDLDTLNTNFSKLKDCGLEQADIDLLANGTALAALLIPMISETDVKITYQYLYNRVLELKASPQYKETIRLFKISEELSKRNADIANWEEDKKLLEALGTPQGIIDSFHYYLQENSDPTKTYTEVFRDFGELNATQDEVYETDVNEYENGIFKNSGNVNYEELLQESINLNKPLLLYFTGYACVNARKMEEFILSKEGVREQLKNQFHFVSLYVDDKSMLPENEWVESKVTNKIIKTIGNKNSELQMLRFKVNAQPYFVIIDSAGNEVGNRGYTPDINQFKQFLNTAE